jgi:hypothetical protein
MTLLALNAKLGLPYAQDWNLNIQRSFGSDWLFEIAYIGTKGTKLPRFIEGNPAVSISGETWQDNANQGRLYSGCTLAPSSPPCVYSSVEEISGIANSTYHDLQSSLRKRFSPRIFDVRLVYIFKNPERCFVVQTRCILAIPRLLK